MSENSTASLIVNEVVAVAGTVAAAMLLSFVIRKTFNAGVALKTSRFSKVKS